MSTPPLDPKRRSFIAQLVRSFLEMVDEWRLLRTELAAPGLPEQPASVASNSPPNPATIAQLQQLPPTHLFFLGAFRKPRPADAYPELPADFPDKDWATFLEATPQQVTEQLLALGALVRADLVAHLDERFKHDELQAMLRERSLPVSGSKAEVARRLAQADALALWAAVGDLTLLELGLTQDVISTRAVSRRNLAVFVILRKS